MGGKKKQINWLKKKKIHTHLQSKNVLFGVTRCSSQSNVNRINNKPNDTDFRIESNLFISISMPFFRCNAMARIRHFLPENCRPACGTKRVWFLFLRCSRKTTTKPVSRKRQRQLHGTRSDGADAVAVEVPEPYTFRAETCSGSKPRTGPVVICTRTRCFYFFFFFGNFSLRF
jgi:hypothetical protein